MGHAFSYTSYAEKSGLKKPNIPARIVSAYTHIPPSYARKKRVSVLGHPGGQKGFSKKFHYKSFLYKIHAREIQGPKMTA